jgi:hypothetical protein
MKISGKVVDIDNEPLISANITLKSGSKAGKVGTNADFDGNFSLESESFTESDIFDVSYIGFAKQTFTAKELQNKKITLKESTTELGELVIDFTKPKNINQDTKTNKVKEHFIKNKYAYAGFSGLLGLALILVSIKKK